MRIEFRVTINATAKAVLFAFLMLLLRCCS